MLHDISFHLDGGRSLAVVGPSGAGKTTLLAILGLLERPTSGEVLVDGVPITGAGQSREARRTKLGFVFQDFNLVPQLTVRANLELALDADGVRHAETLLDELGIDSLAQAHPSRLSAGEQQRVAIVRALAKKPSVVLADEPTASLDPDTRNVVLDTLRTAMHSGAGVVIVTHDETVAQWADAILRLDARTGTVNAGSGA